MTTIPTTPEVRRFNAAVEKADNYLFFKHDQRPVTELLRLIRSGKGFWLTEAKLIADELEAAYAALEPQEMGVTP